MGYKVYFNSYDEIINFIDYTSEFSLWQTRIFRMSTLTNMSMDIDTKFSMGYMTFGMLRPYITKFKEDNISSDVILDVKLICPSTYKTTIDPNNYYNNFYINFYSNPNIHYFNLTYEESSTILDETAWKSWVGYIVSMYNKWWNYYKE
jgi:hypothetical protein